MTVVAVVVAMSLVIGLVVGMVSGYSGGAVDSVLMRVTEMFQSVPRFFLAILVVGLFGSGLDNLILLLGLTSWDLLARVVRAESLSLRKREFVDAARSIGVSPARILVRHILPNVLPSAVVVASLVGSRVILIEAALAFIGLGDPNAVSLGSLLDNAQQFLSVAWWMSVFPGCAIAVVVLGLNLLGDAVNDLLNPLGMAAARPRRAKGPPVPHGGIFASAK
jgi:peptide/nickel transport system permease protein